MKNLDNYNYAKKIIEENGCTIIDSYEDYIENNNKTKSKQLLHTKFNFIGVCGHKSSAVFTNFKTRGTGKRCKNCVSKYTSDTLKINGIIVNNTCENNSIELVEKYLSDYYDIKRTNEGCTVDIAIREKDSIIDEWIPIQMKSTNKISHKMYSFRRLNVLYKNMLIICICLLEEKIWVIPYNHINHTSSNLNISMRSKYNEYLVPDNTLLYTYMDKYKKDYIRLPIKTCMTPVSDLQKREQEYIQKREKYIDFLEFEQLKIQNTPTDFMINGKKIQEKVCGFIKEKSSLIAYLSSNNGKSKTGTKKFRTYRLGENDYYWLHSSIDDRFWIIPEGILFEKGYLSNKDETKTRMSIRINVKNKNNYGVREWIREYEYNYLEISKDKEKII